MLRIHCLQQWFGLRDPAEEAPHDRAVYRKFAKLDGGFNRLFDENSILGFRQLRSDTAWPPTCGHIVNDLLAYKMLLLTSGSATVGCHADFGALFDQERRRQT